MPTPCTISSRLAAALTLLAILSPFTPQPCPAASGVEFKLPAGPKYPSGLSLRIDARGIDANGYRPVRITVSTWPPNKPLRADRQLRIVLHTGRVGSWRDARISQVIELSEGSTSTTATILVPQLGVWTNLSIDTFEGGEKLLDLSQNRISWSNPNNWSWNESKPSMLFLDYHVPPRDEKLGITQAYETSQVDPTPSYDLPDVRPLLRLFPDSESQRQGSGGGRTGGTRSIALGQPISDTALLTLLAGRTRTELISPLELPERWLELSQFDIATISLADLARLQANQSRQFAALQNWLSTGPLLIVYGVGDQFSELSKLEKVFDLPLLEPASDPEYARGWTQPSAESYAVALQSPPYNDPLQPADPSGESSAPKVPSPPSPPPFLFRRAAAGCLVAISAENPFPGKPADWNWIFKAVPENHWQWSRRTGVSMTHSNGDYWKFLVPGVGRAPVKSFLVLVSLFAMVIGPINYWLLARARRLYLLLLTVPVGAVFVTLSLFGFAVVADGFHTRVRIRSYADLDQHTGRATALSWQSYYAAVAPSSGLQFPDDTAVFPFLAVPNASGNDKTTLLVWDTEQQFRSGYLSSRTPTQFVVSRAVTTRARLLVNQSSGVDSLPTVENHLGAKIKLLLLRDAQGNYFTAKAIAGGAKTELAAANLPTVQADLQSIAQSVELTEPEGYDSTYQSDNLLAAFGIRRWRYMNSDIGAGEMNLSLLETNLAPIVRPGTEPHPLLAGSYLAILDHSPFVVTGAGPATEQQSLHVLRARY